MPRVIRHGALFLFALCSSFAGYHLVLGMDGPSASAAQPRRTMGLASLFEDSNYKLSDLKLLDRSCYFIRERYVEPTRIRPAEMFDAALDAVERKVDSVLLQREPGGQLLHVSVGAFSTTLTIGRMDDLDEMRRELSKVARVLDERISEPGLKKQDIEYAMINGVLSTLDPHSSLLPPQQSKDLEVENDGEFGGLGITITLVEGRLTVEYPLEDSPAHRSGIKAGDQIVRIDEESTINMTLDEAVSKLRGPVGAPVKIMVMRDLFDQPRPFEITREVIKYNPPEGRLLEGGVGYLRIKNFNANVTKEMDSILTGFQQDLGKAPAGLILDLRDDPGGLLNQAVEVSSRFLEPGAVVVSTVMANNEGEVERSRWSFGDTSYPMVVLTNAYSASASEIVAGALRNLDRAAVIGERTFGKGSVQHLFDNADESRLKLTVAHYLTPGEKSIQAVGIPPDIELLPYVIQNRKVVEGRKKAAKSTKTTRREPAVTLLWRTRVTRESDLSRPLDKLSAELEKPSLGIAFLDHLPDEDAPRSEKLDLARDWEVQFARDVLLNTKGNRRADVVMGAAEVVQRREREEKVRIEKAFREQSIDWTTGEQPQGPAFDLKLDLGADEVLLAGSEEQIQLHLTNESASTAWQVFAVAKSEADWIDGTEYFFGKMEPGQTRTWSRRIKLPEGYPTELDGVSFSIRDQSGKILGEKTLKVKSQGKELPTWNYSLRLFDDGSGTSRGNGNGLPEVGEIVDIELTFTNTGTFPAKGAYARLRNQAGRSLDLKNGVLELGAPEPGSTVSGRLSFELRDSGEKGWVPLELSVGCDELYDYASVVRGGFYEFASQKEKIMIPLGEVATENEGRDALARLTLLRSPPRISVTRSPGPVSTESSVVISGIAQDDRSLKDLIVYQGKEKVYYRGGGGAVSSLPFSVERDLKPGLNSFFFLLKDDQGLTTTRQVGVFYEGAPATGPKN